MEFWIELDSSDGCLQEDKSIPAFSRYSPDPDVLPLESLYVVSSRKVRALARQGGARPLRGICYEDTTGDIRSFAVFFVQDIVKREQIFVESRCEFSTKGKFLCGVYGKRRHVCEWDVKCSPVTVSYGGVGKFGLASTHTVLRRRRKLRTRFASLVANRKTRGTALNERQVSFSEPVYAEPCAAAASERRFSAQHV